MFYSLNATSLQAVTKYVSIFSKYIGWCEKEGYSVVGFNHLKANPMFKGIELEKYVNKIYMEQKYLSKEDLMYIVCDLPNAQDSALFLALFEGLKGEKIHELTSLTIERIDLQNCKIKVFDIDGSDREVKISNYLIELLIEANNEKAYKKINQENDNMKSKEFKLTETRYVFRPSKTKSSGEDMIKGSGLARRVKEQGKVYNNPYLTASTVWESGMINMGKEILKREGIKELQKEHYQEINRNYGRSEDLWYNTKRVVSKFVKS